MPICLKTGILMPRLANLHSVRAPKSATLRRSANKENTSEVVGSELIQINAA